MSELSGQPPLPPPPTTEDLRWEKEAQDARHASLEGVRSTAEKWTGGVAALLGVGSTAAVLAAPKVGDVSRGFGIALLAGAAVAVILALCGMVYGALAAQGSPKWVDILDGVALRSHVEEETPQAIARLRKSRWLVVTSAAFLVVTAALGAWAQVAKARTLETSLLVVPEHGPAYCGKATRDGSGRLLVRGRPALNVRQLTAVQTCPGVR